MSKILSQVYSQIITEVQKLDSLDKALTSHSVFCLFACFLCLVLKWSLSSDKSYFIVGFLMSLGKCFKTNSREFRNRLELGDFPANR